MKIFYATKTLDIKFDENDPRVQKVKELQKKVDEIIAEGRLKVYEYEQENHNSSSQS